MRVYIRAEAVLTQHEKVQCLQKGLVYVPTPQAFKSVSRT
jgi:hypothetical protein